MNEDHRSGCSKRKCKAETLLYLTVQLLLIAVIFVPTVFFIIQPVHNYHANGVELYRCLNKTGDQQNKSVAALQCKPPLIFDEKDWCCIPPCNWTNLSDTHAQVYYGVMVVSLWVTLIVAVITMVTWAATKSLHKFPHVVRFYLMLCCICLACSSMLPLRVGLSKVFCSDRNFWDLEGYSSTTIVIQGALMHYFNLAICFWSTCFVANTYSVIVLQQQFIFEHSTVFHVIQLLFCWLGPAVIVVCCVMFDSPAYKFLLVDFLTAQPSHAHMAYFAITLPMQLSLGVSLVLLCSIVRFLRKARHEAGHNVIRRESESEALMRVERQFISMTLAIVFVIGLVLSEKTLMDHRATEFIHEVDQYFICLLHSNTTCKVPNMESAVRVLVVGTVMAPGFLCMFFFALLFTNKECRQIWLTGFKKITRLFAHPLKQRPRSDTDGARSRCSSTMIFLTERRKSADLATDGNPGKAPAQEPCADGLVKLTTDQLQASRSERSPFVGGGSDSESREEGESDGTKALRDVDVSVITAGTGDTKETKGIGSFADGKVSNSCENLTQL